MKKFTTLGFSLLLFINAIARFPYQNPNLSFEARAKDLIGRLAPKEKATLMCDVSDVIPRLKIKKFNWWSEALHGLANNDNVTVFPEPVGMATSLSSTEVVQVYVHRKADTSDLLKTVKGFQKLNIAPGKTATASINLPYDSFGFYDAAKGMTVLPCDYGIL